MSEYITKEQAWEIVKIVSRHADVRSIALADKALADMPTADVAPVVHARWERYRLTDTRTGFIDIFMRSCSHCRKLVDVNTDYKYCPQCGARMDGDQQ